MTLFFNLEYFEREAKGDYKKLLDLLYKYKTGKLLVKLHKYGGHSFLLHPGPLFNRDNIDILYKIQYLKLAARRDYTMYTMYNVRSLDLSFFPDLDRSAISTNPLLRIENNHIHFLYEENKQTKKEIKWH